MQADRGKKTLFFLAGSFNEVIRALDSMAAAGNAPARAADVFGQSAEGAIEAAGTPSARAADMSGQRGERRKERVYRGTYSEENIRREAEVMFESYCSKIDAIKSWLNKETDLEMSVAATGYPLIFTFRRRGGQLSLFDEHVVAAAGGRENSISFEFGQELIVQTTGTFDIDEPLFQRLKGLCREANRLYLNEFCAAVQKFRHESEALEGRRLDGWSPLWEYIDEVGKRDARQTN